MAPLNGPPDPNGTCNHEAPPPPPQEQIGEVKKIKGLREVHVAMKLMEEFLQYVLIDSKQLPHLACFLQACLIVNRSPFWVNHKKLLKTSKFRPNIPGYWRHNTQIENLSFIMSIIRFARYIFWESQCKISNKVWNVKFVCRL